MKTFVLRLNAYDWPAPLVHASESLASILKCFQGLPPLVLPAYALCPKFSGEVTCSLPCQLHLEQSPPAHPNSRGNSLFWSAELTQKLLACERRYGNAFLCSSQVRSQKRSMLLGKAPRICTAIPSQASAYSFKRDGRRLAYISKPETSPSRMRCKCSSTNGGEAFLSCYLAKAAFSTLVLVY